LAITLSGNDPDGDALNFVIGTPPAKGQLSGTSPNLTYTPALHAIGTDSFTFIASDGTAQSAPATVTIQLAKVNHAPTANSFSLQGVEDSPVTVTLSGTDPDRDPLSFLIGTAPAKGQLSGTGANLIYTPAAHTSGTDSFTYMATDGSAQSAPATVTIQIAHLNHPPTANSVTLQGAEDTPLSFSLTGSDPDANALTFQVSTPPTKGQLSGTPPNLTYTPAPHAYGVDSFAFVVNDGSAQSSPATVTIQIAHVNHAPSASGFSLSGLQDTPLNVTLSGTDPDADALTYQIITSPTRGQLSGAAPNLLYTPSPNTSGSDSFTYLVSDGVVQSAPVTVSLQIAHVNHPPSGTSLNLQTSQNQPLSITLTGTDIDGDALTFLIVTPPSKGQLSGNGATLVYNPNTGATGADSFTYAVRDGVSQSAPASVTIQIAHVNQPPVITAIPDQVIRKNSASYLIPVVVSDIDSTQVVITATSGNAGLIANADILVSGNNLLITPLPGATGSAAITVSANDSESTTELRFQVTITNSPPVATDDQITTFGAEMRIDPGQLTANDTDPDGDAVTLVSVSPQSEAGGTVQFAGGAVIYIPPAQFAGGDSFTYTIKDTSGAVTTGVVRLRTGAASRMELLTLEGGTTLVLKITGAPNSSYQVLSSQDTRTWVPVAQGTGTSDGKGEAEFRVSTRSGRLEFYRVEWP